MADATKRCRVCARVLPFEAFHNDRSYPDGHKARCKECLRSARKPTKAKPAKPAGPAPETMTCTLCHATKPFESFVKNKYVRYGRQRHCKTCSVTRVVAANRAHAEAHRARATKWRANNPERRAESDRINRYRRRSAKTIRFTPAQLDARMSMFGHRCWMCGGPFEHVDHVKPISKGGAHMLCNLRPACMPCNNRKRNQWPFHQAIPRETANATVGVAVPPIVHATLQNVSVTAPLMYENWPERVVA